MSKHYAVYFNKAMEVILINSFEDTTEGMEEQDKARLESEEGTFPILTPYATNKDYVITSAQFCSEW